MKLSDPRPAMCSSCLNAKLPPERYVDFERLWEGTPVLDRESGAIAVAPSNGLPMHNIELHLCEACVKEAVELLAVKPELHARQRLEIRRRELDAEHWKAYAKRLEATLEDRPERPRDLRRKVA